MELTRDLLEGTAFGEGLAGLMRAAIAKLPSDGQVVAMRLVFAYTRPDWTRGEVEAVGQTISSKEKHPVDLARLFLLHAEGSLERLREEVGEGNPLTDVRMMDLDEKPRERPGVLRGPRRRPRRTPT